MIIKHPAIAGTLESSDTQVTIEPGIGTVEIDLTSSVWNQYGRRIEEVVRETLARLEVTNAKLIVVDKGALDCTIKARVEGAVFRAADCTEQIRWGGNVR